MQHFEARSAPVEHQALGPGYSGPQTATNADLFASRDGVLQVGVWTYAGTLVSTNPGDNHQIWIVLEGSAEVEMGEQTVRAGIGDVIVLEAPYGPKTLVASSDFRAIWIATKAAV